MSEYQYYEFQAVDRPLSRQQMAEIRALSTRAEVTSTRFNGRLTAFRHEHRGKPGRVKRLDPARLT
jgi:hypothetical protein